MIPELLELVGATAAFRQRRKRKRATRIASEESRRRRNSGADPHAETRSGRWKPVADPTSSSSSEQPSRNSLPEAAKGLSAGGRPGARRVDGA